MPKTFTDLLTKYKTSEVKEKREYEKSVVSDFTQNYLREYEDKIVAEYKPGDKAGKLQFIKDELKAVRREKTMDIRKTAKIEALLILRKKLKKTKQ